MPKQVPVKSMDLQLKEIFEKKGHPFKEIYKRLPPKLMTKPLPKIKDELKKLINVGGPDGLRLDRPSYIQMYQQAKVIKQKSGRKVQSDDSSFHVPLSKLKETISRMKPGGDQPYKNKYVREAARAYHTARNEHLLSMGFKMKEPKKPNNSQPNESNSSQSNESSSNPSSSNDSSKNIIEPASYAEIGRFTGWLVGLNDPDLDCIGDGTVMCI